VVKVLDRRYRETQSETPRSEVEVHGRAAVSGLRRLALRPESSGQDRRPLDRRRVRFTIKDASGSSRRSR